MVREMSVRRSLAALAVAGLVAWPACARHEEEHGGETEQAQQAPAGTDREARAAALAHEILIVDTHVDVPYRLEEEWEDISQRTEKGIFDYPRAMEGGLNAPFMSIYVPADLHETEASTALADKLIDMVEKFQTDWPDKFEVARSTADVRRIFAEGKIALPMGMENGSPIRDDLAILKHFRDRGISYITLTHAENNQICDASFADEKKWGGLSPFGRQVVEEMNRQGIMIDVSHLSDDAIRQVMELTKAPVIASHSSCRFFTPGWERNIPDDLIRLVADKGGVIQINFGSSFLTEEANKQETAYWAEVTKFRKDNNLDDDSPELEAFQKDYWKDREKIFADVSDVVDHIDHVRALVGVDHVGLGSDFDGVGDSLPDGLKDVSGYPHLIREMLERGYSEDEVRKVCGENLMRVWSEVERIASKS